MKKVYTKPIVVFENFTLNTSISAGCDRIINPTEGTCAVDDSTGLFKVFTEAMTNICNVYESSDAYDGFCYHVPTEGYELFNS